MLYVCAAAGFDLLRRFDWKHLATVAVIVFATSEALYGCYRQMWNTEPQHMRPVAVLLAARFQPGDRIYVYNDVATVLRYYYPAQERAWILGVRSPQDPQPHREQLERELSKPGRVWMIFSNCRFGECETIRRQASNWRTLDRVAGDVGVSLFLARDQDSEGR
jgi:hypothetical protein